MVNNLLVYTKSMSILYVEDNEDTKEKTKDILEHFFKNVYAFDNAKEAYQFFVKHKNEIDILFTDIEIPYMNGIEFSKKVRSLDKNISIIILSAYDHKNYLMECIKLNVLDYILKPYSFDKLVDVIKKIVTNKYDEFINLSNGFYWCNINNTLFKENSRITLTKNERAFLKLLIESNGAICSSDTLEEEIFEDFQCNARRVRNLVFKLKKKLGGELVETIYSEGYRILLDK